MIFLVLLCYKGRRFSVTTCQYGGFEASISYSKALRDQSHIQASHMCYMVGSEFRDFLFHAKAPSQLFAPRLHPVHV